jgi:hypothetical protein
MGCEASGTNLVSLILDSHSRIAVCRGSHYYLLFAPERRYYGRLELPANRRRLVLDFLEMVQAYGLEAPPAGQVMDAVREPSFEGVLAAFLECYAAQRGKARAGERSSLHYRFLTEIQRGFPDSPVVFTMRDPRDVALAHRQGFGFDADSAAASWNQAYLSLTAAVRPVHLIRYESLVRSPHATLKALCGLLGESFEDGMLEFYHRTPQQYKDKPHHERLFGPLDERTVGAFRELPERDIARIETLCSEGMRAMGYEPVTSPSALSAAAGPGSTGPGFLTRVRQRLTYYGLDRHRWARGLRRWKILLRARLRSLVAFQSL